MARLRVWASWLRSNVLPSLVGSVIVIVLIFAAGTLYLRLTTPASFKKEWPIRYVDGVGWLFKPNATVRWTNELDFWVEERANSLGFLDREPAADLPAAACRVVFIGDSFVEAAQVKNAEKMQSVIEGLARERGQPALAARAYGYSGTGQLNQLPFYDLYARKFAPALVVLVFVGNDFANNSAVLEAVRTGFDPAHPPRVFSRIDQSGRIVLQPADARWKEHLIPLGDAAPEASCWACRQHQYLSNWSTFYRWIANKIRLLYPALLVGLEPKPARSHAQARVNWLAKQPQYAGAFGDWNGDADMDQMFFRKDLPPAFEEALAHTRFAFDEFKRRVEQDGGSLVVLVASQVHHPGPPDDDRYFTRLREITGPLGLDLLDQYGWLDAHKQPQTSVFFQHDGHWNQNGHHVAAEMVLEYLTAHPQICARNRP